MIDINKLIMDSMKSRDKVASETYKLLKAKILEFNTSKEQREYTEAEEINIIKKMIDDRNKSMQIYNDNNRTDLAEEEYKQINVLKTLLPTEPTREDIETYLNIHYPNGIDKKDMGNVIREVKNSLLGADGKLTAQCVKEIIKH